MSGGYYQNEVIKSFTKQTNVTFTSFLKMRFCFKGIDILLQEGYDEKPIDTIQLWITPSDEGGNVAIMVDHLMVEFEYINTRS